MKKILFFIIWISYYSASAQTGDRIFYYYRGEKLFAPVSTSRVVFRLKENETLSSRVTEISALLGVPQSDINPMPKARQSFVKMPSTYTNSEMTRVISLLRGKNYVQFAHPCFKSNKGKDMGYGEELVVKLKRTTTITTFNGLIKANGCALVKKYPYADDIYIVGAGSKDDYDALAVANRFYETGLFEYSEPDLTLFDGFMDPNDPLYNLQWAHKNTGSAAQYNGVPGADMKIEQAWTLAMGAGIKVAVIDEGVDLVHPDLQANLLQGYNTITGTSNPGDGGPLSSANAHGTNCAGIIAAISNNGIGVSGVAPLCKIIPVNIAASNGVFTSDANIATGFDYARLQGADVMTNSWGGGSPSSVLDDAINRAVTLGRAGKGCIVLFAAGNDNAGISYPASIEKVICVGGISMCNQRKSPTSCDGETWGASYGTGLDVVAPCVKIATTDISGPGGYSTGDYNNTFNGTSSATPNAAGVVALVLSANTNLTGNELRIVLENTADKIPGYTFNMVPLQPNGSWNAELGYGRVNAYNAILAAQSGIFCNVRIVANGATRLCSGQSVNLSVINPVAGTTYQWRKDALNLGTGNSILANANSNYDVVATAANGCMATSAPIKVIVLNNTPPLTVNAGTDKQICIGSTVQLGGNPVAAAGSPGLDEKRVYGMDWFSNSFVKFSLSDPNHFDTIKKNMVSASDYSASRFFTGGDFTPFGYYVITRVSNKLIKVDTANGNQTVIATVVPPTGTWTGLSWDPSTNTLYALSSFGTGSNLCILHPLTGAILSTINIPALSNLYWIAVRNNGDMYTLSANNYVYKVNKATGALTILPNPTGVDINFAQDADFDPVTDSLYLTAFLQYQNQLGDFRLVNTSTGVSTLIGTLGSVSEIDATGIAGEKYTYNWTPSTGLSNTNVSIPFASPTVTTTYTLTVTDMCGTMQSDQVVVTVYPKPLVTIVAPKDSICVGETVRLSATKNDEYTYQWYRNAIPIAGATDSFYVATFAGAYSVRVLHHTCDSLSIPFIVKTCAIRMNNNNPETLCTAYFYDSGGPDANYSNNEFFVKTIFPSTPGNQVQLNLTVFSTELNLDTLIVYDGPSTSSPILAKLHGSVAMPATFTAANGSLTLSFRSNGSGTAAGWEGTISCYQPLVYRSKSSGNINDVAIWEVKSGNSFVNATRYPTASDDSIIIQPSHIITINVPVNLDQVLVRQDASLIAASQVTINNGVGDDILFINGSSGGFKVWPEPATDFVNIQAQHSISSVQCFNKTGKLVYEVYPGVSQCRIKIDKWMAGVYQLKIIIEGKEIFSKFSKQ